jgi:RNase P subunit RPR2
LPNRRLSKDELDKANSLLNEVRAKLIDLSSDDKDLLFAYRRKIAKELGYDERSKPMVRRKLKALMRNAQSGICPICNKPLPTTYTVLDRINAAGGYVESNVRLICEACDRQVQMERRYA